MRCSSRPHTTISGRIRVLRAQLRPFHFPNVQIASVSAMFGCISRPTSEREAKESRAGWVNRLGRRRWIPRMALLLEGYLANFGFAGWSIGGLCRLWER